MNLRSPVLAMLWENWKLTRVEAAQRTALGLLAGAGALTFLDAGATYAFWILVICHAFIWFSIAKLNGGRFADGYKPGFPFHLLHTRPLPTSVYVGVALAYDAISGTVLYLASAAFLGWAFDQPLPLFSMALPLLAGHLSYALVQWSTRSRTVQWGGSMVIGVPSLLLLYNNTTAPLHVEFSGFENLLWVSICVGSIVGTVAGVARQRRGESVSFEPPLKSASGGYPEWLINALRIPCPTSSATRAQVWFEMRSSGLPVLMIGFAIASLTLLTYALSIPFEPFRYAAIVMTIFPVPLVVLGLGDNAFGIRRKQGRAYASSFDLAQPAGTGRQAGIKLLVRLGCMLAATGLVVLSLWGSTSLIGAWGSWMKDGHDSVPDLLALRTRIFDTLIGSAEFPAAPLLFAALAIVGVVTWLAARDALRIRYPSRLIVVQWMPAIWGLSVVFLSVILPEGDTGRAFMGEYAMVSFWISSTALAASAVYFLWNGLAERAFTARYACAVFATAAAFALAGIAATSALAIIPVLWFALLMLAICAVAPWALHRARHA